VKHKKHTVCKHITNSMKLHTHSMKQANKSKKGTQRHIVHASGRGK